MTVLYWMVLFIFAGCMVAAYDKREWILVVIFAVLGVFWSWMFL